MPSKKAVLLVNLGTPDSPEPKDVYRYLIEFLTDGRVIDIPWLSRQALVRGIIVPFRYKTSAKCYKEIWTDEGSPLMVYGERVKSMLQDKLGEDFHIELAMRYQNPSLESALEKVRDSSEIIVLPLFPQYASATTGSVHQKVMDIVGKWEAVPHIEFINSYPTEEKMIQAFCERAKEHDIESYDHVLFSFHGLPERQLRKTDRSHHCLLNPDCCKTLNEKNKNCYAAQCNATAQAIAKKLGLTKTSLSYQSRLGRDPWIQPYTSDVLQKLVKEGKKRVLVFCPAFVCDCLETTFEIGVEYKEEFIEAGGEELTLVQGLNDHPLWVEALEDMVLHSCAHVEKV